MSHWNHRIIKSTVHGEDLFAVHEVQYNHAGAPVSYTDEAVILGAMPLSELSETLSPPPLRWACWDWPCRTPSPVAG